MGFFGSTSLTNKFIIILCSLIAAAFGAGLIKLLLNKRKLKKAIKAADLAAKGKSKDEEKLIGRELDEGDLFGVRALERGFFGGVPQSRPGSARQSYVAPPQGTSIRKWSQEGKHSTSSSVTDMPGYNGESSSSVIASPKPVEKKASQLRSHSLDDERDQDSSHGVVRSVSPNSQAPGDQTASTRPHSYLPRLLFPDDIGGTDLLSPTLPNSSKKSKSKSISKPNDEVPESISTEQPESKTPTSSLHIEPSSPLNHPPYIPSRAARQSSRSIFPRGSNDHERPSSSRSNRDAWNKIPIPPMPSSPNLDCEQQEGSIVRNSIASTSRKSVSVHRPSRSRATSQETTRSRAYSAAASSIYSTTNSVMTENTDTLLDLGHSRSLSNTTDTATRSRSHDRRSSSRSLSRTRDSIRGHSRKKSSKDESAPGNRRSRDRDQIHFDPTSHHRNHSGSIQGRKINFDYPRESPFSKPDLNHSKDSSISTSSTVSNYLPGNEESEPKLKPVRSKTVSHSDIHVPQSTVDPSMLSVNVQGNNASSDGRFSRASLGDLYDSYYRQSVLTRNSIMKGQGELNGDGSLGPSTGNGLEMTARKERPPQLNPGIANETIVEIPSPAPSPMAHERFPNRI